MGLFFEESAPDRYGKVTRTPRIGRIVGAAVTGLFLVMSAFGSFYVVDPGITLHELEKRYIQKALDYYKGNKSQAAQALGIGIKTLYNRLHEYGMTGD